MSLPTVIEMSLKKIDANSDDFYVLVDEMRRAGVGELPMSLVTNWRDRLTSYILCQQLYLARLREDMEYHGIDSVPSLKLPTVDQVRWMQSYLYPEMPEVRP